PRCRGLARASPAAPARARGGEGDDVGHAQPLFSWRDEIGRTDRSVLPVERATASAPHVQPRQATAYPERCDHRVRGARLPPRPGERGRVACGGGEGDRIPVFPHQGRPPPRGARREPRAARGGGRTGRRSRRAGGGPAPRHRALHPALLLAAAGCDRGSRAEAPAGETRPEAVTITVASVATRPVERMVSVVGTLAANAQADLASEVEGQVVVVDADLGDRVRRDQVLARVRGDVTEARLREAEASLEKAVVDEARARPLRADGVISTQEYEQVRTALEVARARRDQLRIELDRVAIRAPF